MASMEASSNRNQAAQISVNPAGSRHNAPHSAAFEGWYSRFLIPSTGASVIFVICSVRGADTRPHMLSLTYVSPEGKPLYQKHIWPSEFECMRNGSGWLTAGTSREPGAKAFMRANRNGRTMYEFRCDDFTLKATTWNQEPFLSGQPNSTPAGWMVNLPLPLHWHVHSLASEGSITLSIPELDIDIPPDTAAVVHQEKNWANSFPRAHMWLQGYNPSKSSPSSAFDKEDAGNGRSAAHFCLAGGRVYSFLSAYILTFRNCNPANDIYLRPPFTLSLFGISPFLRTSIDWPNRRFALTAANMSSKIVIEASAPADSFFNLGAPFRGGHKLKALAQSMDAVIEVRFWRRDGWLGWLGFGPWVLATTEVFTGAGLEFGGDYYGEVGVQM